MEVIKNESNGDIIQGSNYTKSGIECLVTKQETEIKFSDRY